MTPYRIALVEYLNTRPFTEGLRLAGLDTHLKMNFGPPVDCASWFAHDKVDISLCPVGALPDMGPHKIWGSFCIGADGPVRTVMLLSRVPLEEIRRVRLDDHSRTSNHLLRILAARWWRTDWTFYTDALEAEPQTALMIGDKVFRSAGKYPYRYDLAEAWKALTGFPMVFAVWIAKPGVPEGWLDRLDMAFAEGLKWVAGSPAALTADQLDYLQRAISFEFGAAQRQAMALYLRWTAEPARSAVLEKSTGL